MVRRFCLSIACIALCVSAGRAQSNVSVFATGLNNPRGLTFGSDGSLFVAEGGAGGTQSTVGVCEQVPGPIGPYTGGMSARISRITRDGVRHTVVDHLPSSQTSPDSGSLTSGVADVKFVDGDLYAILAGAGCSHGLLGTSNAVIRIHENGTWTEVADLSAYQALHPVSHPDPGDYEPDGTWYSMVAVDAALFAVEPNHQELDKITRDGRITRIVDLSKMFPPDVGYGWYGPTAMTSHGEDFYVGNLHTFPIVDGSSMILRITKSGKVETVVTGLTTVVGLAFDRRHRLYVLENTTGNPFPTPGTGKVLRIDRNGDVKEIATGLFLPTAMTFGPDGDLYVSNVGFGPPPIGLGQIIRITIPDNHGHDDQEHDRDERWE
jgi:hypothetical protein